MKKMLKGFTLVEIMIVVAIIAILAAVAIPNFVRYRKTSQMNACISNLKQIQMAYEQASLNGAAPATVAALVGKDAYIKTDLYCPADTEKLNDAAYTLGGDDTNPTCSALGEDKDFPHALPAVAAGGAGGEG